MELNALIVKTDSPSSDELLVSMDSEQTVGSLAFIRREGRNRSIRFAKRSGNDRHPYIDAEIDPGAVVSMAIGTPDLPPTSGTWSIGYGPNETAPIAYNISAASMATALNGLGSIIAAGGVTVQNGGDGAWIITFVTNGARDLFAAYSNALVPISNFNALRIVAGTGSLQEVQVVTLRQDYLAFSNDFAPTTSGAIAVDHLQTGDPAQPDIFRIAITGAVNAGTWLLSSTQAAEFRLTPQANSSTPPTNAIWEFRGFPDITFDNVPYDHFDLEDDVGPVRFWANINSGSTPPAVPGGGRLVEVPLTDPNPDPTNYTDAGYIQHQFNTTIINDGGLNVNFVNRYVAGTDFAVQSAHSGIMTVAYANASVVTVTLAPQFTDAGPYQSTAFLISDANGTVAVWFNVAGAGTQPAIALSADRAIEITTVTPGMSAEDIVDELVSVLDADPQFAVSDNVTFADLTMSFAGPRPAPSSGTSPVGVATVREGRTISQSFPFNASAGQLQQFLGDVFNVTSDVSSNWDLIGTSNGANATITVDGSGLDYAAIWEGSFVLSTVNMFLQFAASDGAEISSKFEIQVVEPGGQPCKLYQGDCTIRADVIDADNLVIPGAPNPSNQITFLVGVTGYTGGGASKLDGVSTTSMTAGRAFSFVVPADGFRVYQLTAGTAAESSPSIIRPDDYAGGTNEKYWQSVL